MIPILTWMGAYDNSYYTEIRAQQSQEKTFCSMTRIDAHIRYSPYMTRLPFTESPLSHVCKGLRDRHGSASEQLALSINSRRFCKERQSYFSSSASSPFSLSLFCFIHCFVLGFTIDQYIGDPVSYKFNAGVNSFDFDRLVIGQIQVL